MNIFYEELPDGVRRRLDVMENGEVFAYINLKYLPNIGGKKDEHQRDI